MKLLVRLAQILGLNAVPVVGVLGTGWTNATALALYWCETLMLTLFVALRIELHRRATNKRGHYSPMEVTTKSGGKTTTERKVVHYSVPFLAVALAFSLGQAVFLFVMLEANDRIGNINADDLKLGLRATAVLAGIGLLIDLIGLRDRPFAWVRAISDGVLRRVFLVQLAIIIGVVAVAWLDAPQALLVSFVGLKVWTDITSQVPQYNPREAPKWMVRLLGAGFADYYRKEREDEDQRKATEEEEFAGTPMPAEKRSGGGRLMVAARRGDDNSVGLGRKASAGQRKIAKYGRRG